MSEIDTRRVPGAREASGAREGGGECESARGERCGAREAYDVCAGTGGADWYAKGGLLGRAITCCIALGIGMGEWWYGGSPPRADDEGGDGMSLA